MTRLWVVEVKSLNGNWNICDIAMGEYVSTNYHRCHQIKCDLQKYLEKHSKYWADDKFRAKEYVKIGKEIKMTHNLPKYNDVEIAYKQYHNDEYVNCDEEHALLWCYEFIE